MQTEVKTDQGPKTKDERSRAFVLGVSSLVVLAGCLLIFTCVLCLAALAAAGIWINAQQALAGVVATETAVPPTAIPVTITASPTPPGPAASPAPTGTPTISPAPEATPTPKPEELFALRPPAQVQQQPVSHVAIDSLNRLLAADFPVRDYYDTAVRLGRYKVDERTVIVEAYALGDYQTFNVDEGEVVAVLAAVTDHVYFWVDTRLEIGASDAATAATRIEEEYYPAVVAVFGEEWRPGVDNDPHFSILHLAEVESSDHLGFFDSADEYPGSVSSGSNEQEMIYLNMDALEWGQELYYGTIVHELQHLIHWRRDGNESVWLDEGLAQLAESIAGLDTVDTHIDYLRHPDTRLNDWSYEDDDTVYNHYGAAYLFSLYLWEQLGDTAISQLAAQPLDGLAAVRAILEQYRPDLTLETFIGNWVAATYLDEEQAGSAYHYAHLNLTRPAANSHVKSLPFTTLDEVNPFGVHYLDLKVEDQTTIAFAGDTLVELTDAPPPSGEQMWFVPPADNLDATLTATFDLGNLTSATLEFWAWYDLEADWDFAYVAVSTDDGDTWRLLSPQHASAGEYGPAFNGRSEHERDAVHGWVRETISLKSYAGRPITLRFEVLTDSAEGGRGFALDDIAIPELGYVTDVETNDGRWQAAGFVRSGWQLPQRWSVQYLDLGDALGDSPQVIPLALDKRNLGQWTANPGALGGVLAIIPLTPFTDSAATYWLQIDDAP